MGSRSAYTHGEPSGPGEASAGLAMCDRRVLLGSGSTAWGLPGRGRDGLTSASAVAGYIAAGSARQSGAAGGAGAPNDRHLDPELPAFAVRTARYTWMTNETLAMIARTAGGLAWWPLLPRGLYRSSPSSRAAHERGRIRLALGAHRATRPHVMGRRSDSRRGLAVGAFSVRRC